ncbi:MAG: TFIIB-type zinc ribbon-containing protein [Methanobrevibacter sp.]|uniref:TFIIB-type zinc ribbon-containing protein n=1 Tax=Methanobrevibacter sp. TaxID=66852 RepID=UPI003F08C151
MVMKLNNYTILKHAERYCPFCKTSGFTLLDEFHGEIFCEKCGTVLHNFTWKIHSRIIQGKLKKR